MKEQLKNAYNAAKGVIGVFDGFQWQGKERRIPIGYQWQGKERRPQSTYRGARRNVDRNRFNRAAKAARIAAGMTRSEFDRLRHG